MNAWEDHIAEDRRLAILQLLNGDPDWSHRERLLLSALEHVGHAVTLDQLHADLIKLKELNCVGLTDVDEITVARLTDLGQEVARGRVEMRGVRRPSPDERKAL